MKSSGFLLFFFATTFSYYSISQTTIFFQGFENATTTCTENWGYTGGSRNNQTDRTGSYSGMVGRSGTSTTMTFDDVDVSGMAGLNLQIYHSIRGGSGPGMDTREGAVIQYRLDGGAWQILGQIGGFGDHSYAWTAATGGSASSSSGCNVYQAPNPINFAIPGGTNTIAIRTYSVQGGSSCTNYNNSMNGGTAGFYNRTDEGFHIDDISITTTSVNLTNVWLGATDEDWHTCSNWSLGIVPTAVHNVLINQSGNVGNNCRVSLSNGVCNNLTLTTTNTNTQDLEVRDNQTLNIGGSVEISRTGNGTGNLKFEAQDGGIINVGGTITATVNTGITTVAEIELQAESNGQINVTGNVSLINSAASTNPFVWISLGAAGVGSGTFNCNNLTLDGNGTGNANNTRVEFFGANNHNFEVRGNFLMQDNARFNATNATAATSILFGGNYTNNTSEAQMIEGNNSRFTFNGGADQTISTSGFNEVFNSLTLNKSGGDLILNRTLEIKSNTTFTSGNINSSAVNLLIFRDNATASSMSNNSFTNGPVRKIGNDAFIFPVGKNGWYRHCAISAPSNTTHHFTAEYFMDNPWPFWSGGQLDVGISHISTCEYWILDRTNGTSNVDVTLSWDTFNAICSGVIDPSTVLVGRWDGTKWTSEGNGGTTGIFSSGTVISDAPVTNFSPFTLITSSIINTLNLEWLYFTAAKQEEASFLEWSIAGETSNSHFEILRSTDGLNFENIGEVSASDYNNKENTYRFDDRNPYRGINYYRIKQFDKDGASTLSQIRSVNFDGPDEVTIKYSRDRIDFDLPCNAELINVYSMNGRNVRISKNLNSFFISRNDISSGIYVLSYLCEGNSKMIKFHINE